MSVLQLSIFSATEGFVNGRPASSLLVYFRRILGFSLDVTIYRRAWEFTSSSSTLVHRLQLLSLKRLCRTALIQPRISLLDL